MEEWQFQMIEEFHVGRLNFKIEHVQIVLDAVGSHGFWKGKEPFLQTPTKGDLGHRAAVLLS